MSGNLPEPLDSALNKVVAIFDGMRATGTTNADDTMIAAELRFRLKNAKVSRGQMLDDDDHRDMRNIARHSGR